MNYKTYAEAKIANPDCEIVTTTFLHSNGASFEFLPVKYIDGYYRSQSDSRVPNVKEGAWVIANHADYCSTLKEFLEAGLKLAEGDKFIGIGGYIVSVENADASNMRDDEDDYFRYILSAAALNGGCKIPKTEPWTVYNNTLPLSALTDEQYGKMRRAHDAGNKVEVKQVDTLGWCVSDTPLWDIEVVYRIKQKSKRESFIETSVQLMTSETERTMEQMFGAQFDAGARYKDLTQHFGENI